MAIPKNREEALDADFRIDEAADARELNAWMTWTSPAIKIATIDVVNAKFDHEVAEKQYDILFNREYMTSEAKDSTTKKIEADINEKVIEASFKVIEAKRNVGLKEAVLSAMVEKAGCIRKIATLRHNMSILDEGTIADRRNNNPPISHEEVQHKNQFPSASQVNMFGNSNSPQTGFFM